MKKLFRTVIIPVFTGAALLMAGCGGNSCPSKYKTKESCMEGERHVVLTISKEGEADRVVEGFMTMKTFENDRWVWITIYDVPASQRPAELEDRDKEAEISEHKIFQLLQGYYAGEVGNITFVFDKSTLIVFEEEHMSVPVQLSGRLKWRAGKECSSDTPQEAFYLYNFTINLLLPVPGEPSEDEEETGIPVTITVRDIPDNA